MACVLSPYKSSYGVSKAVWEKQALANYNTCIAGEKADAARIAAYNANLAKIAAENAEKQRIAAAKVAADEKLRTDALALSSARALAAKQAEDLRVANAKIAAEKAAQLELAAELARQREVERLRQQAILDAQAVLDRQYASERAIAAEAARLLALQKAATDEANRLAAIEKARVAALIAAENARIAAEKETARMARINYDAAWSFRDKTARYRSQDAAFNKRDADLTSLIETNLFDNSQVKSPTGYIPIADGSLISVRRLAADTDFPKELAALKAAGLSEQAAFWLAMKVREYSVGYDAEKAEYKKSWDDWQTGFKEFVGSANITGNQWLTINPPPTDKTLYTAYFATTTGNFVQSLQTFYAAMLQAKAAVDAGKLYEDVFKTEAIFLSSWPFPQIAANLRNNDGVGVIIGFKLNGELLNSVDEYRAYQTLISGVPNQPTEQLFALASAAAPTWIKYLNVLNQVVSKSGTKRATPIQIGHISKTENFWPYELPVNTPNLRKEDVNFNRFNVVPEGVGIQGTIPPDFSLSNVCEVRNSCGMCVDDYVYARPYKYALWWPNEYSYPAGAPACFTGSSMFSFIPVIGQSLPQGWVSSTDWWEASLFAQYAQQINNAIYDYDLNAARNLRSTKVGWADGLSEEPSWLLTHIPVLQAYKDNIRKAFDSEIRWRFNRYAPARAYNPNWWQSFVDDVNSFGGKWFGYVKLVAEVWAGNYTAAMNLFAQEAAKYIVKKYVRGSLGDFLGGLTGSLIQQGSVSIGWTDAAPFQPKSNFNITSYITGILPSGVLNTAIGAGLNAAIQNYLRISPESLSTLNVTGALENVVLGASIAFPDQRRLFVGSLVGGSQLGDLFSGDMGVFIPAASSTALAFGASSRQVKIGSELLQFIPSTSGFSLDFLKDIPKVITKGITYAVTRAAEIPSVALRGATFVATNVVPQAIKGVTYVATNVVPQTIKGTTYVATNVVPQAIKGVTYVATDVVPQAIKGTTFVLEKSPELVLRGATFVATDVVPQAIKGTTFVLEKSPELVLRGATFVATDIVPQVIKGGTYVFDKAPQFILKGLEETGKFALTGLEDLTKLLMRGISSLGDVGLPSISLPSISLPSISIPSIPEISLPQVNLPNLNLGVLTTTIVPVATVTTTGITTVQQPTPVSTGANGESIIHLPARPIEVNPLPLLALGAAAAVLLVAAIGRKD